MQIGLRLHDAAKLPIEERLQEVRKQGFTCVHLALSKVMPPELASAEALTPGYAMYLKNLFEKNELAIAVLGCYLNLATPDEGKLQEFVEKYRTHIRFASQLGCGVVGTETGAPNTEYKFEPACHSEEALELFIERLRPIVKYAEKMGVIFAIEPVWKHIVCNPKRARMVLDAIDSPNLQIILDPVNLLDISNYENQIEIVDGVIELLGKDVSVVHLKDFVVEDGGLKSVAAGTGQMNYESILKFIKKRKPFIHTTLENTVPANAVQAKNYILERYQQISVS